MENGEHLAEEPRKHRAYTMIMQRYLMGCFIYKKKSHWIAIQIYLFNSGDKNHTV